MPRRDDRPLTPADLAHAIIDGIERVGSARVYYQINHVKGADIRRLADLVAGWCREVGVEVALE